MIADEQSRSSNSRRLSLSKSFKKRVFKLVDAAFPQQQMY
jgi:hypothetical protein